MQCGLRWPNLSTTSRIRRKTDEYEVSKSKEVTSQTSLVFSSTKRCWKTYTALSVASGLGDKIAVVDTEHASAALYADEFGKEYYTLQLTSFEVENYIEAIELASREGYDVLIIDSLSHAWAGKGGIP